MCRGKTMKGSVRIGGILLIAALVAGSWVYSQQAAHDTTTPSTSIKEIMKEKQSVEDRC